MRLLAIVFASIFFATSAWSCSFPPVKRGTPYPAARGALIKQGWSPSPIDDLASRGCNSDRPDMCKPSWTEVEDCSGTGEGPCLTTWNKGDNKVVVLTAGPDNEVTGFRCR